MDRWLVLSGLVLSTPAWGGLRIGGAPPIPTERIEALCGAVPRRYGVLPPGRYLPLAEALAASGIEAVQQRICSSTTRAEVALGFTYLGQLQLGAGRPEGAQVLLHAADVWGEPLAMVALGEGYLHGAPGLPPDPVRAWRYLQAALAICDQDPWLAGSLGIEIRGLLTSFALLDLDPQVQRPQARGFIEQHLEAYLRLSRPASAGWDPPGWWLSARRWLSARGRPR